MSFVVSQYYDNSTRPSFFEVVAQERMMPSLKTASRYVLTVLAQRYYQLIPLLKWHEEVFSVLQAFIEYHHLTHFDASFSEHIYALVRSKILAPDSNEPRKLPTRPLTLGEKTIGLLLLVGAPYVKGKIDECYKNALIAQEGRGEDERIDSEHGVASTWNWRLFMKWWPYVSAAYEGSFFLYIMLYLCNDAPYFSPLQHIQKVTLRRIGIPEYMKQRQVIIQDRLKLYSRLEHRGHFIWKLTSFLFKVLHTFSDYSRGLLLTIVFLFKFLEWWYASESYLKPQKPTIPPPPRAPKRASGSLELPRDTSLCPMCKNKRTNPTLLSVSGYVFCYTCVQPHVQQHKNCPVAKIPATTAHLRRLFEM